MINGQFSIVFAPRNTAQHGEAIARFAALGLPTLRRWVDSSHVRDVWVLAPSAAALEPLRRQAPALPWRVVSDLSDHPCPGLAAAGRAKTPAVLLLDEDAILTRALQPDDLWVEGGRLRVSATNQGMGSPLAWLAAVEARGDGLDVFDAMQNNEGLTLNDAGPQALLSSVAAEAADRLQQSTSISNAAAAAYWLHVARSPGDLLSKHALDAARSLAIPFAHQPHVDLHGALQRAFAPDATTHWCTWLPSEFYSTPVALDALLRASSG